MALRPSGVASSASPWGPQARASLRSFPGALAGLPPAQMCEERNQGHRPLKAELVPPPRA